MSEVAVPDMPAAERVMEGRKEECPVVTGTGAGLQWDDDVVVADHFIVRG